MAKKGVKLMRKKYQEYQKTKKYRQAISQTQAFLSFNEIICTVQDRLLQHT